MAAGDDNMVVAAVQPRVVDGDSAANSVSHAESITRGDARLVVFPELSLTGYVLDSLSVDPHGAGRQTVVNACASTDSVALIGAPVQTPDGRFIAMASFDSDGASVAHCTTFLGGNEDQHFASGGGPGVIEVGGWRVGMGSCRDTRIEEHVRGTAALGVDAYACGVLHHETELAEQQRWGRRIATVCRAPVVMASFAGPPAVGMPEPLVTALSGRRDQSCWLKLTAAPAALPAPR